MRPKGKQSQTGGTRTVDLQVFVQTATDLPRVIASVDEICADVTRLIGDRSVAVGGVVVVIELVGGTRLAAGIRVRLLHNVSGFNTGRIHVTTIDRPVENRSPTLRTGHLVGTEVTEEPFSDHLPGKEVQLSRHLAGTRGGRCVAPRSTDRMSARARESAGAAASRQSKG